MSWPPTLIEPAAAAMRVALRHDYRQQHAVPVLTALKAWLEQTRAQVAGNSGTARAVDYTLRRWEAQRIGPPSVRAGRKVFYRRAAVEEWLEEQEQSAPRRRRAGGRR